MRTLGAKLALVGALAAAISGMSFFAPALAEQARVAAKPMYGRFAADGVNIRSEPSTNSANIWGQGYRDQRGEVFCQSPGDWYLLKNLDTGVTGYVNWPGNFLLEYGTPRPPLC